MSWDHSSIYSHGAKSDSYPVRLVEKPIGIKAYYSNGTFSDTGTSDAIGVYVCTSNACFMIPKDINHTSKWDVLYSNNGIISGVYATDSYATAKTDYAGLVNQEYLYNIYLASHGCEAANICFSSTITGYTETPYTGYLGSCGEWNEVLANKDAINSMMTAIGGTSFSGSNYYWTST